MYVSLEKRKIIKKLLKDKGIEIDCDLDTLVISMDLLLYQQQYIDAYEGFHSGKEITKEELKIKSCKRTDSVIIGGITPPL